MKGFRVKNDFITEDQFLTFDEADRFVAPASPEWRTFLVTALKTGLRAGELLALTHFRQFSLENSLIPAG